FSMSARPTERRTIPSGSSPIAFVKKKLIHLLRKKMSHLVTEKNIATCVENKSKVETHIAPLQRERSD
ncbi:MAG: hypothetical protein ACLSG5_17020, partial [Oscillospiraceae bacterium]